MPIESVITESSAARGVQGNPDFSAGGGSRWRRWAICIVALAMVAVLAPASVSAQTSSNTELYSRDSDKDIEVRAVNWPKGMWGNSTSVWLVDGRSKKLKAYSIASGSFGNRERSKDINVSSNNTRPYGIWSDGTTMWVANRAVLDHDTRVVSAYRLSDGSYQANKSFTLDAGNDDARGIWSDGTTMWVLQSKGRSASSKMYAYKLSNGARDSDKDIDDLVSALDSPNGLWSDGTTIWAASWDSNVTGDIEQNADGTVYAYTLSTGNRDTAKEFSLDSANSAPSGLWSNETTLWVTDTYDDKLYAYHMTGTQTGGL